MLDEIGSSAADPRDEMIEPSLITYVDENSSRIQSRYYHPSISRCRII